jgi:hypothetical protein
MPDNVETYSPRGFLYTLIFCTALAAVGGLAAYLSAPERLRCARGPAGSVDCRLTRLAVSRVAIRDVVLSGENRVALDEPVPESGIGEDDTKSTPLPRLRFLNGDGTGGYSLHARAASKFIQRSFKSPSVVAEWESTLWGDQGDPDVMSLVRLRSWMTGLVTSTLTVLLIALSAFALANLYRVWGEPASGG